MTKILKKVKLNAPASTSTGVDPTRRSDTNPYTQEEFFKYFTPPNSESWPGGWVEGMGYIPPNVNVVGSSIMVVPSSDPSHYYQYAFFFPIDKTLHHTYLNPGNPEIVLTDISVKANINVYKLTVKVSITKKSNYDIRDPHVKLCFNNLVQKELQNQFAQLTDDKIFSAETTEDLPYYLYPSPTISLIIDCNYYHDNEYEPVTYNYVIYSQY